LEAIATRANKVSFLKGIGVHREQVDPTDDKCFSQSTEIEARATILSLYLDCRPCANSR